MKARAVLGITASVVLIGSTAHAQRQMGATEIQRHNEMVLRLKKQTKWHAGSPPPVPRAVYLAPDRHQGSSTEAADGVYVHISGGHVEARPPEWPPRTIWFTVRAPLKAGSTDLAGCVFHIEGRGNELLLTLDVSMRRDEEKKEGVFDIVVVPELAKKARLTFSYTTKTDIGPTVANYYTLRVRDHIPKVQ
jgi:hypothetical protein